MLVFSHLVMLGGDTPFQKFLNMHDSQVACPRTPLQVTSAATGYTRSSFKVHTRLGDFRLKVETD